MEYFLKVYNEYFLFISELHTDVPLKEIYRQVIIPDMLQLEHGIQVESEADPTKVTCYIGSVHMVIGDHMELCKLAGIITGINNSFLKYLFFFLKLTGSNANFTSRHMDVHKDKYADYLQAIVDGELDSEALKRKVAGIFFFFFF